MKGLTVGGAKELYARTEYGGYKPIVNVSEDGPSSPFCDPPYTTNVDAGGHICGPMMKTVLGDIDDRGHGLPRLVLD